MAYFAGETGHAVTTTINMAETSVAQCEDGRVLIVYRNAADNKWYQGYFKDYATFLKDNNAIEDITQVSVHDSVQYTVGMTITNTGNGELWMQYCAVVNVAPGTNGVYMYKSPSGNGGDWVLSSTLHEQYFAEIEFWWSGKNYGAGNVLVTSTSRWIMNAQYPSLYNASMAWMQTTIYYSDDEGANWTEVPNVRGASWWESGSYKQIAEYNGALYRTRAHWWGGGATFLQESLNDGDTWTTIQEFGYNTCIVFWGGDDGYLYVVHNTTTIWKTNGEPHPLALVANGGSWEVAGTMSGMGSVEDILSVITFGDAPHVLNSQYISSAGLALQTCMQYVSVEECAVGEGSMVYDGKTYKFMGCFYIGPITTHLVGETQEYTYPGNYYVSDGVTYGYLASGITDPTAPGGFGTYLPDTTRQVTALADRENFVNFYYIAMGIPTVTIDPIHDDTVKGFLVDFDIIKDNGFAISECGFAWGKEANPTLEANYYQFLGAQPVGSYSTGFVGIIETDTTYHVRAFAINSAGIGYSPDVTFTVGAELPVIIANSVSKVTSKGFDVNVEVTAVNDVSVDYGFVWGTHTEPVLGSDDKETTIGNRTTTGAQNYSYAGAVVVSNTATYYLRAWATNSVGTSYSNEITFQCIPAFWWEFIATPDHNVLNNLDHDDHPQYHNDARGDARYNTKTEITTLLNNVVTNARYYEPLTNGDPVNPELLFYNGDIIMGEVK